MSGVAVVCEDAGGAAALAPVVLALAARGEALRFALGALAARVFAAAGIDARASIAPESAGGSRLVLAATSPWGERLEARAVIAARGAGVPSVALVDFWARYEERLSYPAPTGFAALPDRVLAIDEWMRRDLVAAGVDEARVVVTGSPAFDAILAGPRWAPPPEPRVLFLSQPMAALFGDDPRAPSYLGYTERSVLAALASIVAELDAELVVRPHPREDEATLRAFAMGLPCRVAWDASGSLRDAVARARAVVGMTTMALVEAALMGAPALSAQLGRKADGLPTNRTGLTRDVPDAASLLAALRDALALRSAPPPHAAFAPGATARVVAVLDAIAPRRVI